MQSNQESLYSQMQQQNAHTAYLNRLPTAETVLVQVLQLDRGERAKLEAALAALRDD